MFEFDVYSRVKKESFVPMRTFVGAVCFTRDSLVVDLMDGRTISVPLRWYPKLLKATHKQRVDWVICGGGFGIHWVEIDEDLSTEGLLRGAPSPIKMRSTHKPQRKRAHSSQIRKNRVKVRQT